MDAKQAEKIFQDSLERHRDLSNLSLYPPFVFDQKKKEAFVKYITDLHRLADFAGDFYTVEDPNDEESVETKKAGLKFLQELDDALKKGDDHIPKNLTDDVAEARLYEKRYGNPMAAFDEAKKNYNVESDLPFF